MPYRQPPAGLADELLVPLPRPASDGTAATGPEEVTTARMPALNVAAADRLCRLHRIRNVCQNAITAIDAALDRQGSAP